MTKTHKAVLSTLAVLCLLFMGSGVAQAQECFAFQSSYRAMRFAPRASPRRWEASQIADAGT